MKDTAFLENKFQNYNLKQNHHYTMIRLSLWVRHISGLGHSNKKCSLYIYSIYDNVKSEGILI